MAAGQEDYNRRPKLPIRYLKPLSSDNFVNNFHHVIMQQNC